MSEYRQVTIIGFCNLENRDGKIIRKQKYFKGETVEIVDAKINEFLDTFVFESFKGWDGNHYPKYEVNIIEVE